MLEDSPTTQVQVQIGTVRDNVTRLKVLFLIHVSVRSPSRPINSTPFPRLLNITTKARECTKPHSTVVRGNE